jgi:LSD1 subclass zinc finger protein
LQFVCVRRENMEEEKALENYINNKCPNCGSDLKFLPGSKNIKCISCM